MLEKPGKRNRRAATNSFRVLGRCTQTKTVHSQARGRVKEVLSMSPVYRHPCLRLHPAGRGAGARRAESSFRNREDPRRSRHPAPCPHANYPACHSAPVDSILSYCQVAVMANQTAVKDVHLLVIDTLA